MSKPIPKGREIDGSIVKEVDSRFLSSFDIVGKDNIELTIDRV